MGVKAKYRIECKCGFNTVVPVGMRAKLHCVRCGRVLSSVVPTEPGDLIPVELPPSLPFGCAPIVLLGCFVLAVILFGFIGGWIPQ